jgi:hypothetical protein
MFGDFVTGKDIFQSNQPILWHEGAVHCKARLLVANCPRQSLLAAYQQAIPFAAIKAF